MTSHPLNDDDIFAEVLVAYDEHPMDDGDVALLTDLHVIQEIEGLADHWDPVLRRNVAHILREIGASEVVVAIARPGRELLPGDHALWADLREELLDARILVRPVIALDAA
jgi:hypothetical protein